MRIQDQITTKSVLPTSKTGKLKYTFHPVQIFTNVI